MSSHRRKIKNISSAIIFVLSLCLLTNPSRAAVVLEIAGKVRGFDDKTVSIENKDFIYEIKKTELSTSQLEYVKKLKSGAPVTLEVDQSAILKVSSQKKQK